MKSMKWPKLKIWVYLPGLVAVVCSITVSYGQNSIRNPDFETWSCLNAQMKFGEKWTISLEEQFRLKSFSTQFDRLITQFELQRRLSSSWRFTLGLRHLGINDNTGNVQGFEHHFRYHLDLTHQVKSNRIAFKNRFRFQRRNQLGIGFLEGDYPSNYFRLKTSLEFNFKKWKWDPIITNEYFYRREIGELNGFSKCRTGVETKNKLSDNTRLKLAYYFERELKIWDPKITHILTFKYRISLPQK